MMKYIKRSERILKAAAFNAGLKSVGGVVEEVAEYSKWHELQNGINAGSRIQFKMAAPLVIISRTTWAWLHRTLLSMSTTLRIGWPATATKRYTIGTFRIAA